MKQMFEDTIERLLSKFVTPELIARTEQGIWPDLLWRELEDNGLCAAASPENLGGIGASWHDAFVLIRAAGRHSAPAPIAETILANWLLGRLGLEAVSGPATVAVAHEARFACGVFDGCLPDVPWGGSARHVVTATGGDTPALLLLSSSDAAVSSAFNTAREPRDTLVFSNVRPIASAALEPHFGDVVLLGGAMIRSAQIAGALENLLGTAIEYANQREQFGRAIGKFQVIQHQIAVLSEQAALANMSAEAAFAASEESPKLLPVAAAKCVASEAAGTGAAIAHSVLGAIGFTYEHSLHFSSRRLWSWRSEYGGQTLWAKTIGDAVCKAGADAFWPAITSGTLAA